MFKWFGRVNLSPCTRVAGFADHLRAGRLMASRCRRCGRTSFPPRADCEACMGREFEFVEIGGRGQLLSFTRIGSPPAGFGDQPPYTLGLVELDEGGRALAWIGETLMREPLEIGMAVQLVPRLREDTEEIHVYYDLERPGTPWPRTPLRDGGAQLAAREPVAAGPAGAGSRATSERAR